ncbi:MAG: zinc ribbon domain-containing protein [Lachnospiraceae bacterium]|nr:zinc ribbon domain-containing protein [Lachnospiraceae bacterium]
MAGFMDSINKGFATINVKTSNLMESTKLKTAISGRENDIASIMKTIGETVYINRTNFSMDMVSALIGEIEQKYREIEDFRGQLAQLEANEKNILGNSGGQGTEAKIFCMQCGAPNRIGGRFCEKCGTKLAE